MFSLFLSLSRSSVGGGVLSRFSSVSFALTDEGCPVLMRFVALLWSSRCEQALSVSVLFPSCLARWDRPDGSWVVSILRLGCEVNEEWGFGVWVGAGEMAVARWRSGRECPTAGQ